MSALQHLAAGSGRLRFDGTLAQTSAANIDAVRTSLAVPGP
ncbi:hypothetical protein ABZX88_35915 [Kitasatospora aureofaciens]